MIPFLGRIKKTGFLALALITLCIAPSLAQSYGGTGVATYKVSNPAIIVTGSYVQPSQYVATSAGNNSIIFPWYTLTDTVTSHRNSLVDSFSAKILGPHESVYTWCHVTTASGSGNSVLQLYSTADSGKGTDWQPIQTFTITPSASNPAAYYNYAGWPYTSYKWKLTGGTGDSIWWYSGLTPR